MQEQKKNWLLGIVLSIVPVLVFLVGNVIVSSIVQIFYTPGIIAEGVRSGMTLAEMQDPNWITEQLMNSSYLGVATFVADMAIAIGMFFWWRAIRKPEVQIKNAFNGKKLLFLVCVGIAIQFVINVVLALFFLILPENVGSDYEMLSEALTGDGTTSLGMALSVVIAAPIAEDLLMRGVALNYGRKYMNDTAAVIFSSLAFGCMHFSNISMAPLSGVLIQVIYASIMGAILAVVAIRFKSVWASVFVHFIINGSGQLLSLLTGNSEKGDIVGYCFYGVGIIALVVIVIMLIKNKVPSPEAPTYGELAAAKAAAVGEVTE